MTYFEIRFAVSLSPSSRADVHGGAGRGPGRDPAAAGVSGDPLQVLPDRAHALLQEPLWQRRRGRR